jgi:hypothetical protein
MGSAGLFSGAGWDRSGCSDVCYNRHISQICHATLDKPFDQALPATTEQVLAPCWAPQNETNFGRANNALVAEPTDAELTGLERRAGTRRARCHAARGSGAAIDDDR